MTARARQRRRLAARLWRNETGATAVEYGLIVALIAVAIIAAITALSGDISTKYNTVATRVAGAGS